MTEPTDAEILAALGPTVSLPSPTSVPSPREATSEPPTLTREQVEALLAAGHIEGPYIPTYMTAGAASSPSPSTGAPTPAIQPDRCEWLRLQAERVRAASSDEEALSFACGLHATADYLDRLHASRGLATGAGTTDPNARCLRCKAALSEGERGIFTVCDACFESETQVMSDSSELASLLAENATLRTAVREYLDAEDRFAPIGELGPPDDDLAEEIRERAAFLRSLTSDPETPNG